MIQLATALIASALLTAPALAQQKADDHAAHQPATAAPAAAQSADMADGEVRWIDRDAGKITLRHGEIKSLDMPGMTMGFRVDPPRLLDGVQPGQEVEFDVVKRDDGYVVTTLRPKAAAPASPAHEHKH